MTDRLIFVHDKRRDAYIDKTSEIVGLRPAGAYVYVDYGAARVFRYRKGACRSAIPCSPHAGRYASGTGRCRSRTIRCSTTGNMSGWAPERACVRRRSRSRGSKRSMRSRSPQTKSGCFLYFARFSQPASLESETDTECRRGGSRRGEEKFDRRPARRDDAAHPIRRIPVRRCMPI